MLRGIKLTVLLACLAGAAALSGCSQSVYPRLPSIGGIGETLLSPEEQKQAIQDLSAEQKTHGVQAAEEIERRE